jgi:hypothetical protein
MAAMFTDSAQHLKSAPHDVPGLLARTAGQVRQFICGLHGHDALLHFEHGRMSLLCVSCGHESPGWEVRSTTDRHDVVDTTPRLVRMPMVHERRVA